MSSSRECVEHRRVSAPTAGGAPPGIPASAPCAAQACCRPGSECRKGPHNARQCAKRIINGLASEEGADRLRRAECRLLKLRPPMPFRRSMPTVGRGDRTAAAWLGASDWFSLPGARSSGTIWNRSPTRPTSSHLEIGASLSLLMATMVRASLMPVRCWIAPEMPMAMYMLRGDDLSGLADLHFVGSIAGIDGGARCAHRSADLVGEAEQELEVVGAAQGSAARHHFLCRLQIGPVGRSRFRAYVPGMCREEASRVLDSIDAAPPVAAAWKEATRTVATSLRAGSAFHGHDGVACVDWPAKAMRRLRPPSDR